MNRFKVANITVFGVSTDSVKVQKKFYDDQKLNFTLLSDTESKVIDAFGVKKLGGKFAARQSFLVKDGVIIWRDLKVVPKQHAELVLEAAKADR